MAKGKQILRRLFSMGFVLVNQVGSHRKLRHPDGRQLTFAFHDKVEVGKIAIKEIAKQAGIKLEDLV